MVAARQARPAAARPAEAAMSALLIALVALLVPGRFEESDPERRPVR